MPADSTNTKDLPLVPESVLKRRHDLDDLKRKRQHTIDVDISKNKTQKGQQQKSKKVGVYVRKPESFLAKAKNRKNEQIRYRRVKKKGMQKRASNKPIMKTKEIDHNHDNTADEQHDETMKDGVVKYQANSVGVPYVFVIRIREDAGHPPKCVMNILHQLRLKEPNTGIFIQYTPVTKRHLHLIEPWIVYGKPSNGIVEDLLLRRSFGLVNSERVPLSDNTIIERELGNKYGMICMEDLINELTNVGDNFDVVANFLCPFPLSESRSKFEKNLLALKQGKDYGDKGEAIDEYIKQML